MSWKVWEERSYGKVEEGLRTVKTEEPRRSGITLG